MSDYRIAVGACCVQAALAGAALLARWWVRPLGKHRGGRS